MSGANPIYAAIYQFVTICMIFSSSGLTALICSLLIAGSVFSPAEQLVLLPKWQCQTPEAASETCA